MPMSQRGIQVLTDREGLRLTAYKDSVGVWTIGVGHTSAAGPPEVTPGLKITEKQAFDILAKDLKTFEQSVEKAISKPMEEWQYDAFVSICYNIGGGAFSGATFVKSFNAGAPANQVTNEILWWNKPKEIIPRRQGEAVQFRDQVYVARIDPMPAPSEKG